MNAFAAPPASLKIGEENCNKKCSGNPSANCGGVWALDVFETGFDGEFDTDSIKIFFHEFLLDLSI